MGPLTYNPAPRETSFKDAKWKQQEKSRRWNSLQNSNLISSTCRGGRKGRLRLRDFSLVAQMVKRLSTMQESLVPSLGREDPLEKEIATHSSILAWKIPWMEEPGRLLSVGSQRVGHNWVTSPHPKRHNQVKCMVWEIKGKRDLIIGKIWKWSI